LAKLIVDGKVPDIIAESTVYSLDLGALLAVQSTEGILKSGSKAF